MTKKDWQIVIVVSAICLAVIVLAFIIRSKVRRKLNCQSDYFFIGDSTTAHSKSYADQLKLLCGANVVKIAQSGAKTDWMLNQMQNHFSTPKKYDVISILAGSNDIFATLSIENAKANMNNMLALALQNSDNVVLIAPPSKEFYPNATEKHKQLIAAWEKFLESKKGSRAGKRVYYIPLPRVVDKIEYFANDRQHMNTEGHSVLLGKYIDTLNIKNT
jgi:hypothetical protein